MFFFKLRNKNLSNCANITAYYRTIESKDTKINDKKSDSPSEASDRCRNVSWFNLGLRDCSIESIESFHLAHITIFASTKEFIQNIINILLSIHQICWLHSHIVECDATNNYIKYVRLCFCTTNFWSDIRKLFYFTTNGFRNNKITTVKRPDTEQTHKNKITHGWARREPPEKWMGILQ